MPVEATATPPAKPTVPLYSDAIRTAKCLGLPLLAWIALWVNGTHPVLRFTDPRANVIVLEAAWFLPFVTAIFALYVPRRWLTTILVSVLMVPLLCFSAFALMIEGINLVDTFNRGFDSSFAPLAHVPMGGYSVGIYLTNCGALCSFGIAVEQEQEFLPGIMLVRVLPGFEPAVTPAYQILGQDRLRVDVPDYFGGSLRTPARSRVYNLRPYLYLGRRPQDSESTNDHADQPHLLFDGHSLAVPDWECAHAIQRALSNDQMIPGTPSQCGTLMSQALAWSRTGPSP